MKVAILGASGQLGSDLVRTLAEAGQEVVAVDHGRVDVRDQGAVRRLLRETRPEAVVNCAAFHRTEECEQRPEEAFGVNAVGALYVARACAEVGSLCVYISTDYVFDGQKGSPYTEQDEPRPVNVYGASKLAGEMLVRQSCPRWLIVRTAGLFGRTGSRAKGGNFVETILTKAAAGEHLRVVDDQRISPTYTLDLARALGDLLREGITGLVHLTNGGSCTWYELALKAIELCGLEARVEAIASSHLPGAARRPRNSSLTSVRVPALRPWPEALRAYLRERAHR